MGLEDGGGGDEIGREGFDFGVGVVAEEVHFDWG